jgi:predicted branched-subunit amino acid permease
MSALADTASRQKPLPRMVTPLAIRGDSEFRRGIFAMVPLFAGYVPFACLVGVAVAGSVQPAAAWAGVWLIFAGSAHLTVIQLVDSGAGVLTAATTALLVNARLMLLSATLAPYWRGTRIRSRLLAAATLVDPTWMLAAPRFARSSDAAAGRRFYSGASAALWVGWTMAVTIGVAAGSVIPSGAGLDLLAPLCLMSIVAAPLRTARGAACVSAAAVTAVACVHMPGALGLLVSVAAGTAAAATVRRTRDRRNSR